MPIGINLTNVFNAIEDNRVNAYEVFNDDSIYFPDLEDEETILAIQQGEEYDIERAKAVVVIQNRIVRFYLLHLMEV